MILLLVIILAGLVRADTITRTDPAIHHNLSQCDNDGCCPRSRTTITVTLTETTTTSIPVTYSLLLTDSTTIRNYETTSIEITRTSRVFVTSRLTTLTTVTVSLEDYTTSLVSRFFTRQSRVTFQSVATKKLYTTLTTFRVSVRTRQLTQFTTTTESTNLVITSYQTTATIPVTLLIPVGTTTVVTTSYFFDYLTIRGTDTVFRDVVFNTILTTKSTTLTVLTDITQSSILAYGFATTVDPAGTVTLEGSLTVSPTVFISTGPATDTLSVTTTWTYSYLPPA